MRKFIYIDSTTNDLFSSQIGGKVDYQKLKKYFEEENDQAIARYYLQMTKSMSLKGYNAFIKKMEELGWKVNQCIENKVVQNFQYASAIEAMELSQQCLEDVQKTLRTKTETEIILCSNHFSYLTLLNRLKTNYNHLKLTLVCDPEKTIQRMLTVPDKYHNIEEMDILFEK